MLPKLECRILSVSGSVIGDYDQNFSRLATCRMGPEARSAGFWALSKSRSSASLDDDRSVEVASQIWLIIK